MHNPLTMITPGQLGRRNALKGITLGAGAVVLQPFLNALAAEARGEAPPQRIVFVIESNGLWPKHLRPKSLDTKTEDQWLEASLADHELPEPISPLAPFKDRMTIIQGLSCKQAFPNHGAGYGALGCYNARANQANGGHNDPLAQTVDHALAGSLPGIIPVVGLGVHANPETCFANTVSVVARKRPLPIVCQPDVAFGSLFGSVAEGNAAKAFHARNKLLDWIQSDIKRVQSELPSMDREKLDIYLDTFEQMRTRQEKVGAIKDRLRANLPAIDKFNSKLQTDRFEAQCVVAVAALASRLTSVAVIDACCGPHGYKTWKELGVTIDEHAIGHKAGSPDRDMYAIPIRQFHAQRVADLAKRLAAILLLALRASVIVLCGALFFPTQAHADDGPLRDIIDREVRAVWAEEKITAPERSSDSVFLRRVYLDLVGMIPTYEETTAFLGDTDPQKREKLIDKLLADPRYARNQAQVWDVAVLGRNPQNTGHPKNRIRFRQWLATQFEKNEPYDRLVHKLLAGDEQGAHLYYVAYRNTDDLTTATMRLFLGTQLQCAKCHDHPFEPWTQHDYYGMAGFFVRTFVADGEEKEGLKQFFVAERSTGEVSFSPQGAKPGVPGEPVKPKFLGGAELAEPETPKDFKEPKMEQKQAPPKPLFSRREKVVAWITARENPYLAKAAVNRIWAQFMGRGLVHPVDDFNQANTPSHPELLKALETQFAAHQFDVRWLIREILLSEAYQEADVGPSSETLPKFYERAR